MSFLTENRKRCKLDEQKRRQIIALITNGSSRRVAAQRVGCAASTVTRCAARDRKFALGLLEAEHAAEVLLLRRIQAAAEDPKHWRAAAWLLERRNPSDFYLRPPTLITPEQMKGFMEQFASFLHEDLPQKNYRRIIHKIRKLSRECEAANAPLITEREDEWEIIQSEEANAQTRHNAHPAESAGFADATPHRQKEYEFATGEIDATASESIPYDDGQPPGPPCNT